MKSIILGLFLFALAWCDRKDGMSVLIIGDSNTETGFTSKALADTMRTYFGVASAGTGYIPLNSGFYEISSHLISDVTISYQNTWKFIDMFEGYPRQTAKPYLSPSGHWLTSSTVNAVATVTFPGNGVDIYWLANTTGGSFSIIVDNVTDTTVNTAGPHGVQKTEISGLTSGNHTVQFKVTSVPASGSVILLGFDARSNFSAVTSRPVVHNWGNGWSATSDFLDIDSVIFATGLQKLAPDIVVVLLGTNDHLQSSRSALDVKTNLKAIINRIKAAGLTGKIMLVSTFMTNNSSGATLVPQYRAISWPQAASETGVAYWDMSTWFGVGSNALMQDANHVNLAGGKKIGVEMFRQILEKFPPVSTSETHARAATKLKSFARYTNGRLLVPIDGEGSFHIEVADLRGTLILKRNGNASESHVVDFGLVHLDTGMYIVKVHQGESNATWSIAVSR
ncbi:MAG: SGNH/GDSL hydrolase family protein [Fibrobacteria bacterium]